MLMQYGSQLHFWCCFDLVPKEAGDTVWGEIVKAIRNWVTKRCGQQEYLGRRWFFVGGDWKMADQSRFRVQTEACIGNGNESAPEYWAIRFEHPCVDESFRQWRTDIGVMLLPSGRFRVVLTTIHWLSREFIADDPPSPVSSAPGIVKTLIRSPRWQARSGDETLSIQPIPLDVGQGQAFLTLLESPDRPPVVLVTLDHGTGRASLDPARLSRLLAGTAAVYIATSPDVDKELQ